MALRMGDLSKARIVVVGAGVLGLACAASLARRGARVEVLEDRPDQTNASAVAAGMIAPALEAALERADQARADLYREAAERWPVFAQSHGASHWRDGTDWRGPCDGLAARLDALGFAFETRPNGLYVPGESRVAPRQALAALGSGIIRLRAEATGLGWTAGRPVVRNGAGSDAMTADAIVIATGWRAPEVAGLEALTRHITPVKGQIALLDASGVLQRTTRGEGAYLVPCEGGVIVGATMEPGRSDTEVDPASIERLRAAAIRLEPALADVALETAQAGVRGATPDGLPMAGATSLPGVFAALAPRRNGWLLAPLVAETVAAAVAQEPPPPYAEAFRPDRFG